MFQRFSVLLWLTVERAVWFFNCLLDKRSNLKSPLWVLGYLNQGNTQLMIQITVSCSCEQLMKTSVLFYRILEFPSKRPWATGGAEASEGGRGGEGSSACCCSPTDELCSSAWFSSEARLRQPAPLSTWFRQRHPKIRSRCHPVPRVLPDHDAQPQRAGLWFRHGRSLLHQPAFPAVPDRPVQEAHVQTQPQSSDFHRVVHPAVAPACSSSSTTSDAQSQRKM